MQNTKVGIGVLRSHNVMRGFHLTYSALKRKSKPVF
jgi:hypothetical protein